MDDTPPGSPRRYRVMLGRGLPVAFIAGAILVAGVLGFFALNNLNEGLVGGGGLNSVILLIAGFVTVTLVLYLGTLIHRTLGLGDAREALGMPEGSIRALIAMSLILIFSIIGIVVFSAAQDGDDSESKNLTQAEVDRLAEGQIVSIVRYDLGPVPGATPDAAGVTPTLEPRFDIVLRTPMTEESHDFGLQLLSTVSTLVVAVAGFYFGARSVSAAQDSIRGRSGGKGSLKLVGPPSPHPLGSGPVDVSLGVSPTYVDVQSSISGDPGGRLDKVGRGRYRYVPGDPQGRVTLEFSMPEPYEGTASLVLEPDASTPIPAVPETDELDTSPAGDDGTDDPAAEVPADAGIAKGAGPV